MKQWTWNKMNLKFQKMKVSLIVVTAKSLLLQSLFFFLYTASSPLFTELMACLNPSAHLFIVVYVQVYKAVASSRWHLCLSLFPIEIHFGHNFFFTKQKLGYWPQEIHSSLGQYLSETLRQWWWRLQGRISRWSCLSLQSPEKRGWNFHPGRSV